MSSQVPEPLLPPPKLSAPGRLLCQATCAGCFHPIEYGSSTGKASASKGPCGGLSRKTTCSRLDTLVVEPQAAVRPTGEKGATPLGPFAGEQVEGGGAKTRRLRRSAASLNLFVSK